MKEKKKQSFLLPAVIGAVLAALAVVILFPSLNGAVEKAGYPLKYREAVTRECKKNGISEALCFAVILCESGFNPDAVSPAGAKGLMQLTDDTADWVASLLGEKTGNLFDPETNIRYGAALLKKNLDDFGTLREAVAAYNAGRSRVRSWLSDENYSKDGTTLDFIPYSETADYVDKVIRVYEKYSELYGFEK